MVKLLHLPDDAAYRYCKHAVRCNVNHIVYNYLLKMDVDKLVEVSKHENRSKAGEFLNRGYARFSKTACPEVGTEAAKADDQTRVEHDGGLTIFMNDQFGQVRIVEIDGEPWFVGRDVAAALGYTNTKDAISSHVDEEDKQILQRSGNATFGSSKSVSPLDFALDVIPNRGLTIINESGLYALILSSKLPTAKAFKRWVTSEILPTIRKKGYYVAPSCKMEYVFVPNVIVSPEFISGAHDFVLKAAQVIADRYGSYSGMILNQFYDILIDRWGIDLYQRKNALEEAALTNGEEKKVYLIRTIKPNEWMKVLRTVAASLVAYGFNIDKVNQTEGFRKEKILDYDLKTLGEEELTLQMSQGA